MIKELNILKDVEEEISSHMGVMLYFYNDHCAPCISLRPKVIKMMDEKFPKLELVFINSEKSPEIPAHYGVFSNPTIILFMDGRQYFRNSKYISEHQLSEQTERLYKMAFE